MLGFRKESWIPDLCYSSDFEVCNREVALPKSLVQQNFRRARSCENLLDDNIMDLKEEVTNEQREVIGFHFGRPFRPNISTTLKEGYNFNC